VSAGLSPGEPDTRPRADVVTSSASEIPIVYNREDLSMNSVSLRFALSKPATDLKDHDLLEAVRRSTPTVGSIHVSPVHVIGISSKEIVVAILISFSTSVAANNVGDISKSIAAYFAGIGIQATDVSLPQSTTAASSPQSTEASSPQPTQGGNTRSSR
jgi:hypothetical protein